jgi:phage tail sheath protein FI
MPTYLTPGVYFETVDTADAVVPSVRTDVAAFVGVTAQGPLHHATAVESWNQFQAAFGSYIPNAYLAYSAQAFFQNGGQKLYVVRVAAPHFSTMTNSAMTQPADGSSSFVLSVQGFAAGAVATAQQTAVVSSAGVQPFGGMSSIVTSVAAFPPGSLVQVTQGATQAWHTVETVDATTKQLYWTAALESTFVLALPMTFTTFHEADLVVSAVNPSFNQLTWTSGLGDDFDVTQPIQFDTGIGTSSGIFNDSAGLPTLEIQASSPGSWGDTVQVSVSYSNLAATATSSVPQPASGALSFVNSVVGFPQYSLVRIYQTHSPQPLIAYRVVTMVNSATTLLQWDTPLITNVPPFDLTLPISLETLEFGLTVYVNGSAKESFSGLSMNPLHPRYVENIVNPRTTKQVMPAQVGMPSQYIRVTDLQSPTPYPNNLPNPFAPQLDEGVLTLWGGRDGVAALQMTDYTGNLASEKKWGIRTMEDVDEISIVAVPDILIEPSPAIIYTTPMPSPPNQCLPCAAMTATSVPPPAPPPVEATPQFSLEQIFEVQQALIAHCALMQFRFAVLDPPDFGYPKLQVDLGEIQSWRQQFDTMYAALYYPWIYVVDPLNLGNEIVRRIPPSGHVAGVYANTDLTVGVFQAPANTVVDWAQDLTNEVTTNMQAFLNPLQINCIRSFSGRGIRVYGARTLSSDPSWLFVPVRRLISMIEHALEIYMQWVVFEPNNVHLWNLVKAAITNYLEAIWSQGALMGNTAAQAFFVTCDATNNTLATTSVGQMIVEIGVAPTSPAEFVIFRIGMEQDTLEVSEP